MENMWADLVATPEMTHLVQKDRASLFKSVCTEREDLGVSAFSALAAELGIYLLIGSLAIRVGDKVANRSFLFGKDGEILARYDKIHLFDAQVSDTESYRESATYISGEAPTLSRQEKRIGMFYYAPGRSKAQAMLSHRHKAASIWMGARPMGIRKL